MAPSDPNCGGSSTSSQHKPSTSPCRSPKAIARDQRGALCVPCAETNNEIILLNRVRLDFNVWIARGFGRLLS
jgi:hypothetical protein